PHGGQRRRSPEDEGLRGADRCRAPGRSGHGPPAGPCHPDAELQAVPGRAGRAAVRPQTDASKVSANGGRALLTSVEGTAEAAATARATARRVRFHGAL